MDTARGQQRRANLPPRHAHPLLDEMNIQQRQITTGLFLLILLLAFGLRFYSLGAQSLWNDEGTSVAMAQRDLITIARDAARDIHPPLYYWLLSGWTGLFGTSEVAVRALSAILGVALVAMTYVLGRLLAGRRGGLGAAFLAALNPFQVIYSQEARMYMLLAVLTAGAMLVLIRLVKQESMPALIALILLEGAGLYTHYSFVFVLLVLNLAYGLWLVLTWGQERPVRRMLSWGLVQGGVLLLYLPWLPNAVRQVTTWPTRGEATALLPALADTWRWLAFGPTIETAQVIIPLLAAMLLAVFGAVSLGLNWMGRSAPQNGWNGGLLALWVGLPVLLIFVLGLYRETYLKFLLVSTPAVSLLLACGLSSSPPGTERDMASLGHPTIRRLRFTAHLLRSVQYASLLLILMPSVFALRNYYVNPVYARDDYRSIAAYIEALEEPGDAVLLNAPGQQEVFDYYYQGDLPVYPLPERRPLDPSATEAALVELAQPGGRVYAVLWATDESDPERFVEGWLDAHAYKALDSWAGNVRLVVYAMPEFAPDVPDQIVNAHLQGPETDDEIVLQGYSLLDDRLAAGDIAQITLFWQADRPPRQRYKVFIHVLDGDNHIVGQRDAEPGGGARLTTLWQGGEVIADNYGVPIHPATPPGSYRVEVGMYNPLTGQRLATPEGEDQVWLEPLAVERPLAAAPSAALGIQHAAQASFGEVSLLGYDTYRLGVAHQPDGSLQPGDVLQINLYWRAEAQPDGNWQVLIENLDPTGQKQGSLVAELVGGYPTGRWQTGDVWRGQFNLTLPADAPTGRYQLRIEPIMPDGTSAGHFLSEPFVVGP
jgi:mannosyltransferase